jgi:hypothetical protein
LVVKKEYNWAGVYIAGTNKEGFKSRVGWPKVDILQRRRRISSSEPPSDASSSSSSSEFVASQWTVVTSIQPLMTTTASSRNSSSSDAAAATNEIQQLPVTWASLSIQLDASTGLVSATVVQGKTVSSIKRGHFWWIKFIMVLLVPVFLWMSYRLVGHVQQKRMESRHVDWLTDFYVKNAPEVCLACRCCCCNRTS